MEPKFPYQQIADDLRIKIKSGELRGQLPTIVQLAERYGEWGGLWMLYLWASTFVPST